MSIISKATIAEVLGISTSDISDSVYTWAKQQFFLATGLKETAETKTYRKFFNQSTIYCKLPDTNISTINTLTIDNEDTSFTLFTDLKVNPDTGLVYYSGGFSGGQLVEINYTVSAYTHLDIHDLLISLFVAKAMSLFTPDKLTQVKEIKIGNYSKKFGSAASNLENYQEILDQEINRVIDAINGDDSKMSLDLVI